MNKIIIIGSDIIYIYGYIYIIKNEVNNKYYIGQTTVGFNKRYKNSNNNISDIEKVYRYHKISDHPNLFLMRSIEKYGFNAFKVNKCFDVAFSKEELNIKEKTYIQLFNSFKNGYNFTEGGENGKRNVSFYKRLNKCIWNESFCVFNNVVYFSKSEAYKINKNNNEFHINLCKKCPLTRVVVDMNNLQIYYLNEELSNKYDMDYEEFKKMCKRNNNKKYNLKIAYYLKSKDYDYMKEKEWTLGGK